MGTDTFSLAGQETWILLRGWIRHHLHWAGFDEALAKHRNQALIQCENPLHTDARTNALGVKIALVDLIGNGYFHLQPSPTTLRQQAEHCMAQIAQHDAGGPLYILAISLGTLAALASIHHGLRSNTSVSKNHWSRRIKGMVLLNPSVRGLNPFWARLRPVAWPLILKQMAWLEPMTLEEKLVHLTINDKTIWPSTIRYNQSLQNTYPTNRRNALAQLLSAMRFTLKEITLPSPVPTLVLCSQGDRLVDWHCGLRLSDALKATFFLHASGGHDLTADAPQWVLQRIDRWLHQIERQQ